MIFLIMQLSMLRTYGKSRNSLITVAMQFVPSFSKETKAAGGLESTAKLHLASQFTCLADAGMAGRSETTFSFLP